MDKHDPKVIATATEAFKKYPGISKIYVDDKGNLHFAPSAKPKQTVITRTEIEKLSTNKNTSK